MLWAVIVSVIVLLAIYVSVGRMLASLTASHQQLILQELNQHLPFRVEARRVSAEWHSFTPTLVLEELRLTLPSAPGHPLQLAGGRVGLDVAGSLRSQTLKSSRLRLEGHPDQPEWLSHVNASVLKVKLATAIIGISSIHLLKTFINAANYDEKVLLWQTVIHIAFLFSALAIAAADRVMGGAHKPADH